MTGLTLSEGLTNGEMSEGKSGQGCLMGWIVRITRDRNGEMSLWLVTHV